MKKINPTIKIDNVIGYNLIKVTIGKSIFYFTPDHLSDFSFDAE
jgi:hypothetical protein